MWDLRLALQFIQENIAQLGGDPEKAILLSPVFYIFNIVIVIVIVGDPLWSVCGCDGRPAPDAVSTHQREKTIQVVKTLMVIIYEDNHD